MRSANFPLKYRNLDSSQHVHTIHWSLVCAVYTWGRGEDGQLGHGDTNDQSSPQLVEALQGKAIVQMACGSGHTIVLTSQFP